MTALDVRGLSVSLGSTEVLHGLDLSVEHGITALLGPSGCGKSTFLRTLAGFVAPTAGTVHLGGQPMHVDGRTVPPRRRSVGYVPQEGALFPHLDVARNVAFGLPRDQRRRAGDRVAEMLDLVELPTSLATRHPHQLSGGQQQRVALARALAPAPALVLLDEPFSSLDAGLREETGHAVVRALRVSGAAALLVTHDQGEALSLADQVAVMAAGRFLQVASPLAVYLDPQNEAVAAFLGHAALVPATAASDGTATSPLGVVRVRGSVASGAVTLAVRPEQLLVDLDPASHGAVADVVGVSFFGHDATVRVIVEGHDDVLVARTPSDTLPEVGQRVHLTVVGDVLAFAQEAGS